MKSVIIKNKKTGKSYKVTAKKKPNFKKPGRLA